MSSEPTLYDYERELKKFVSVEQDIDRITTLHNIGALALNTKNLKLQVVSSLISLNKQKVYVSNWVCVSLFCL